MTRKHTTSAITSRRNSDIANLYLRLFIGGVVLLHNIGKMQTYNEIIDTFPSLLFDSPTLTFAVFTIAEVAFAMMIMCGLWIRFASFLMALGMFLSIFVVVPTSGMTAGTLQFIYMGIYIFFVIAGGGRYALDTVLWGRKVVE
ncbi:MAG: DoxX family protein [Alistipes sp.]|nr:DoxX family protein [Alistipes sp.]MBQ2703022.1 DoxX family protein [Alistipes sp.]MBQ3247245.1 DoxX family protein [Alistipes sp.]